MIASLPAVELILRLRAVASFGVLLVSLTRDQRARESVRRDQPRS